MLRLSASIHRHTDFAPLARPQRLKSRSAVRRNFQKSHATENCKSLARPAFCIVRANPRNLTLASHRDFEWRWGGLKQLRNVGCRNVRDQIAEAIHLQHDPAQRSLINRFRPGRGEADVVSDFLAKAVRIDSLRQKSGNRRKNIAPMKGVAARLKKVMF